MNQGPPQQSGWSRHLRESDARSQRLAKLEDTVSRMESRLQGAEARLAGGALNWDALEFATPAEVARKFGVSVRTVRAWCRRGQVPAFAISRGAGVVWRVPKWWMLPGRVPVPNAGQVASRA